MEWIKDSRSVRDYIDEVQGQGDGVDGRLKQLATSIGQVLGRMHEHNIIHGDLTTSNMLLQGNLDKYKLWLIDFGLSDIEAAAEDKGVDLYVLERAILSSHPQTQEFFEDILCAYRTANNGGADAVIDKLEEVRLRGRKRTMVGWANANHFVTRCRDHWFIFNTMQRVWLRDECEAKFFHKRS